MQEVKLRVEQGNFDFEIGLSPSEDARGIQNTRSKWRISGSPKQLYEGHMEKQTKLLQAVVP